MNVVEKVKIIAQLKPGETIDPTTGLAWDTSYWSTSGYRLINRQSHVTTCNYINQVVDETIIHVNLANVIGLELREYLPSLIEGLRTYMATTSNKSYKVEVERSIQPSIDRLQVVIDSVNSPSFVEQTSNEPTQQEPIPELVEQKDEKKVIDLSTNESSDSPIINLRTPSPVTLIEPVEHITIEKMELLTPMSSVEPKIAAENVQQIESVISLTPPLSNPINIVYDGSFPLHTISKPSNLIQHRSPPLKLNSCSTEGSNVIFDDAPPTISLVLEDTDLSDKSNLLDKPEEPVKRVSPITKRVVLPCNECGFKLKKYTPEFIQTGIIVCPKCRIGYIINTDKISPRRPEDYPTIIKSNAYHQMDEKKDQAIKVDNTNPIINVNVANTVNTETTGITMGPNGNDVNNCAPKKRKSFRGGSSYARTRGNHSKCDSIIIIN
jgi:hypothetical protein